MSIESILVKRRALYKGEVGLFASNPMAEEDLALAKDDTEVMVSWYSPKTLEAQKFLWGLVHKVADNSDRWLDRYEAMDDLKTRAAFTKVVYNDRKKELEVRPKSMKRISDQQLRLLTDKIADIICTEILPGMKRTDLYREIKEMLGDR